MPVDPVGEAARIEAAAEAWFLRLLDPEDAEASAACARWAAADPRHRAALAAVAADWNAPALRAASAALRPARGSRAAGRGRRRPGRARRRAAWLRAAAVAGLAVLLWQAPRLQLAWAADHATAAGEMERIALADGSLVTLNTGSAIAVDLGGAERRVRLLAGEAFFAVAPDAAHPFVVTARHGEVRVTGTEFAVRRDPEGDRILLRAGHVAVRALPGGEEARLEPGEAVTAGADGLSAVARSDTEAGLAWLSGRLELRDLSLAEAAAELARYRRAPVMVLAGGAARVSGSFALADPEAALRALAGAAGRQVQRLPGGPILVY